MPPRRIKLVSEAGLEVSGLIGPYHVGATLTLQCHVDGGKLSAKVRKCHKNIRWSLRVPERVRKRTREELMEVKGLDSV